MAELWPIGLVFMGAGMVFALFLYIRGHHHHEHHNDQL